MEKQAKRWSKKGEDVSGQKADVYPNVALTPSRRGAVRASPTVWLPGLQVIHYTILPNSRVREIQTFGVI
jgi:hypothetical protein